MKAHVELKRFVPIGDERGQLVALEASGDMVPFEVKRMYYIYDTRPGVGRGLHAHRSLRQLLVCVSGACTIECEFPDGCKTSYRLDWPDQGLLVEGLVWREMREFSKDAVLVVLASEHYDERDYIRDYAVFRRESEKLLFEDGQSIEKVV